VKIVLFLFFSSIAVAGARPERPSEGRPGSEFFDRADRDGDGRVSFAEFQALPRLTRLPLAQQRQLFSRLDKDGNGWIEAGELPRMRGRRGGGGPLSLRKFDRDGDEALDWPEFLETALSRRLPEERRRAFFDRLDRNGDGLLSSADRPGWRRGGPPPGTGFGFLDADGDGRVSFEEFRAARRHRDRPVDRLRVQFDSLDRNGDRHLNLAEWRQWRPRMRPGPVGPLPRRTRPDPDPRKNEAKSPSADESN
jgi:Ca2+-binding EF-hand superfamily protein